ncbi:MAG TPA: isochorismatase family protein, partial [Solirubrobacteraceae bacterium]|nr:isochorismatase family protein [Solirubrobacteraceae bacterium]
FFGTPLAAMLAGHDSLVVCGASTSGCVRATVVDALQHNLAPIVSRECVGDRWPAAHDASLFDIEAKYGDVLGLDDVVEILRR